MKTYCGGSTCGGHGDFAICGKPYYGKELHQCSNCEAKDLKAHFAWKPIETAPVNTAGVAVYARMTCCGGGEGMVVMLAGRSCGVWIYPGDHCFEFTHWMQLPEPPNGLVES